MSWKSIGNRLRMKLLTGLNDRYKGVLHELHRILAQALR